VTRRHLALLVLAAWAGSLGWLLHRRLTNPPGAVGSLTARRLGPGAAYYAFELEGNPIGSAGLTVDTLTSGFSILFVVGLDGLGNSAGTSRLAARSEARLGRTFRLLTSRTNVNHGERSHTEEVVVGADSMATLRIAALGQRAQRVGSVSAPDATTVVSLAFRFATTERVQLGTSFETMVFDPLSEGTSRYTAEVIGDTTWVLTDSATVDTLAGEWTGVPTDTIDAWRLEVRSPTPFAMWVTNQGWPIQWEYPFGVRLTRRAFELVETDYRRQRRAGSLPSIPTAPGLVSVSDLGLRLDASTDPIRILVSRRDGRPFGQAAVMFAGGRQFVSGDTVTISPAPGGEEPTPPLRYRNTEGFSAEARGTLEGALRQAVERYGNAADTVASLVQWVARDVRLDRGNVARLAPDLVAETAAGSHEGKVRLFVTLARRAGYPARAVTGVMVDHPLLPRYSWAEVWVDGWLAVDPNEGQVPASTSLLRVMEGPGRVIPLVTVAGALQVTPIAISKERQN
jgi:hypothetical protein